jgi:hypothetical protein
MPEMSVPNYHRNLNPQEMFARMAADHRPEMRFEGDGQSAFDEWKATAVPRILECLGEFPQEVDLNPSLSARWEDNGLVRERWIIDVQPHLSASLLINIPADIEEGERRGAIMCWHGHGPFGKEPIMGNSTTPELRANIEAHNYDYGEQMARQGYVTYAIDWIGAGERNPSNKPNHVDVAGGKDWCNLLYLNATMFGMTSISINLRHGQAATDFMTGLPYVDPERLGVMGLSGGGTMTTWTYFCDPRFRAAEIMCYCDLWEVFGMRDLNYCGMQVAPGLYKLVDLPDIQGSFAPKPLLIDIGAKDTCFTVDSSLVAFERVREIYTAAGAADKLELDLHPGEHGWGGNKSVGFFGRYL